MYVSRFLAEPDCTYCPLNGSCRKVPPEGDDHASVALVGEGPGWNEEQRGRPFVGDSGKLLDELLRKAHAPSRRSLWITNAALCMPRFVDVDPEAGAWFSQKETLEQSTLQYCRPRLLRELAQVNPRVILAVGGYALRSLTGLKGIQKRHGAVIPIDLPWLVNGQQGVQNPRTYVIPMLHPASLLRGESRQAWTVIDVMKKAFDIAREGLRPPGDVLWVSPYNPRGAEQVINELDAVVDELLAKGYDFALDVETNEEDARKATLTVFGFGCAEMRLGVAVSVLAWDQQAQLYRQCWTRTQWVRIYNILAKLLRAKATKWFWNMNFDVTVLERYWPDDLRGPFDDGMHWHWLAQPESKHNLAWACQTHLHIRPWKAYYWDRQKAGEATDRDLGIYNAEDDLYTAAEIPYLKKNVYAIHNEHLVQHQLRVNRLARKAYIVGIPVDMPTLQAARADYTKSRDAAMNKIRAAIKPHLQDLNEYVHEERCKTAQTSAMARGKEYKEPERWVLTENDWSHRSEYQGRWFLYEFLKLPVTRLTKGGADEKNKKASHSYKGVLDFLDRPLVQEYVDAGEFDYRLQRLAEFEEAVDPDDGRLHPTWNSTGIASPRWRCSPNVANLDKKLKKVLKAPPGYVWVGADAAQIEMRILAVLAAVGPLLEIFNKPVFDEKKERWKKFDPAWDSHSFVAYLVYGKYYTEATMEEKDKLRTLVKRVVYGMNYGAHPKKIRAALLDDKRLTSDLRKRLTPETVDTIFNGFHAYLPQVGRWAEAEVLKVRKTGQQVIPPLDRRRIWPISIIEEPKIRNTPIQTAASDIVNLLFCRMDDQIVAEKLDSTMVLHGHDACSWLTREEHGQRVKEIVNQQFHYDMTGPNGSRVHIHGQASIGETVADVT